MAVDETQVTVAFGYVAKVRALHPRLDTAELIDAAGELYGLTDEERAEVRRRVDEAG
jgi:ABC-type multidrug transport system ATPase subunit